MKTFSDSRTIIEQEKRYVGAEFTRRVELLRQFAGVITARLSSTQIKVDGDATDLLAVQNDFVIPRHEFTENHTVTAISFSAGETTITCSGSSFPASGLVSLEIAKVFKVSGGNVERLIEMSNIRFDVEGETLTAFRAQDVELNFANHDGFFANSAGNGLLDNSDVFWLRIYFGWKRSADRVLYFGGVVDRDLIKDDRYSKMFLLTAFGHLKELERYPAWLISEPFGDFLKLSGIELVEITANGQTNAGVKKLEWKFREGNIPGVEILSISKQTTFGFVPFKFRFPNLFKFAWGDWTAVSENTASADLTGADGSTLAIKTTNYDVRDREVFLSIEPDFTAKVRKAGSLELIYDGGAATRIASDFEAVIIDEDSATFVDASNDNDREGIIYEVLQASDAAIYIFSNEPFYGIEIFLEESDLSGTIDLAFSNGLNSWQTLGSFTDNTSDLTSDGTITWGAEDVAGWRPVTFTPFSDENDVFQKFGLRIDLSAYTSGSATLRRMRRYFKTFGADGTALAFKIDLHNLLADNTDEDLIIREISGVWTPCTWYRNITVQSLVEKILAAANYGAGAYTLEDLQITNDTPVISIIGQAPVPFYKKRCKALLWDGDNARLYLGIGNELWSVTETGEFTFIDQLEKINENSDGYGLVELSIRSLALDDGDIHGMAWWDYYDDMQLHLGDVESASFYSWFFKSDGNSIIDILQASGAQQTTSPQYINPCDRTMRKGEYFTVAGKSFLSIGHDDSSAPFGEYGENVIIPFEQTVRNFEILDYPIKNGHTFRDAEALITGDASLVTNGGFFLSDDFPSPYDRKGNFIRTGINYYIIQTPPGENNASNDRWHNFKWQIGNKGLSSYKESDGFIVLQMQRDNSSFSDTNHRIVKISTDQPLTGIYNLSDSLKQPLCGVILDDYLYLAYMFWNDLGTDFSTCILARVDLGTGSYTELFSFGTDAAEASQSITGDEETQTILELVYNPTEQVFYGCLLNRANFEYHVFVYDPITDKMYSTQTGENFTFDKHRQFKDFVYLDDKVYAVCVDKRYQTDAAFLVEMSFSAFTIHINRIDAIDATDWDHLTMIATDDGLFGVTGKGLLWKYSTSFYPRIGYAQLGDKNLREVLTDAVEVCNRILISRADRTLRITQRETYDGSKTLEAEHVVKTQPISRWVHIYDRVEVEWSDPVSGASGMEAAGSDGWERRVLKISNPFVQNRHLARVLASQLQEYFSTERKELPIELRALLQLEEYDRFKVLLKGAFSDLDRAQYWRITNLDFDPMNLQMKVKGLS
jgi:hypothetical protein